MFPILKLDGRVAVEDVAPLLGDSLMVASDEFEAENDSVLESCWLAGGARIIGNGYAGGVSSLGSLSSGTWDV